MKFKYFFIYYLSILLGYPLASVVTEAKPKALTTSQSCEEGTIRRGFLNPVTHGDVPCSEGIQTCVLGNWQGPVVYASCENLTKNCDGSPHDSTINGYLQPTSPKGVPCTPATKTCINGSWVGPQVFSSCSEL